MGCFNKEEFTIHEYNKLTAQKIGHLEIVDKINLNAYCLKIPNHVNTFDVCNVKHFVTMGTTH